MSELTSHRPAGGTTADPDYLEQARRMEADHPGPRLGRRMVPTGV